MMTRKIALGVAVLLCGLLGWSVANIRDAFTCGIGGTGLAEYRAADGRLTPA
jgi:hypothetical protein